MTPSHREHLNIWWAVAIVATAAIAAIVLWPSSCQAAAALVAVAATDC